MTIRKSLALMGLILTACLGLNVAGPSIATAADSAASVIVTDDPIDGEVEVPESPEGTEPPVGRAILARGCGDPTNKVGSRSWHVDDAEADGNDWTTSYKVWYDRCSNVTIIRSVTKSYSFTNTNACERWFGVDQVRLNPGDVGGWNVPRSEFDCGDGDHADSQNTQAPNGTQVFCGNDNLIGMKFTAVRNNFSDTNKDVAAIRIPRPTSC